MEVHENIMSFQKWKQQQQNGWEKTIHKIIRVLKSF